MGFRRKSRVIAVMSNDTPQTFIQCSFFAATLAEELAVPAALTVLRNVSPRRDDDVVSSIVLYGLAPGQDLTVPYHGKNVTVRITKIDTVIGTADTAQAMYSLVLTSSSATTLKTFLKEAKVTYENAFVSQDNYIRVFTGSRYGHWIPSGGLPKRNPNTVVLDTSLMSSIIDDVKEFVSGEADYAKHGVPYKRVVCLHGPPGTGKTSTIFAIASHFNMNIAMLTMQPSTPEFDANMISLVNNLPRRSILIIEDIDAIYQSRTDPKVDKVDKSAPSLSTILNVLDGNLRKHGMIVFMTTNHLDRLDPAMVRPGRVDLSINIGFATPLQASSLYNMYFPNDAAGAKKIAGVAAKAGNLTTADINSRLFASRKDSKIFWATV